MDKSCQKRIQQAHSARTMPTLSTTRVPVKFCRMIRRQRRAMRTVSTNFDRSFPIRTTFALSRATSVPDPMATPTLACMSAGRVVDAVADHHHGVAAREKLPDASHFLIRQQFGADLVDAERHGRGFGNIAGVAGQQNRLESQRLERRDGVPRLRAQDIPDANRAQKQACGAPLRPRSPRDRASSRKHRRRALLRTTGSQPRSLFRRTRRPRLCRARSRIASGSGSAHSSARRASSGRPLRQDARSAIPRSPRRPVDSLHSRRLRA